VRSPLVVCATDGAFGRRRTIALTTVAERAQVGFPPGWGVTTLVDRVLRSVGIEPRVDLEVNDTDTLLDLVEAVVGIAIIPEATLQFGFDMPFYINFVNGVGANIPILFGFGFEYHVDDHIGIGVNTRFGPSIFAGNFEGGGFFSTAVFGFITQAGFAYRF